MKIQTQRLKKYSKTRFKKQVYNCKYLLKSTHTHRQEMSQINNLILYLKELEKE